MAIVILNWNGKAHLERFLPSVLASTYSPKRIIVADNGSTDDSMEWLVSAYPTVERILLESNFGFAKGYNKALKKVEADYYVLLNSDVEVQPGWIEPVIKLMESDQSIAACQPKILSCQDRQSFDYAGAAGGWIDAYGYPFAKGRVFDTRETDHGQYDQPSPVFWASGAALFIRSHIFHEMGGFDGFFFAHMEEIDLCWRFQLAGYQVFSCPQSVVYHLGGGTLPHGNTLKTFLNFRNNLVMLYKNWPWRVKFWKIPFRVFLDAVSAWKGLLSGQPGYFRAVLRAHFAFLQWVCFKKKTSVFPQKTKGTLQGVYPGNLVWQYFIRKKRVFAEIVSKSAE